jgi:hypothetical protein
MTQDEGRFGRVSIPRSSWAPMGTRPMVPRQIVREAFYVYSAVCPSLGKMSSLILPYANTEMMNLFLANVSEEFIENEIIMLVKIFSSLKETSASTSALDVRYKGEIWEK